MADVDNTMHIIPPLKSEHTFEHNLLTESGSALATIKIVNFNLKIGEFAMMVDHSTRARRLRKWTHFRATDQNRKPQVAILLRSGNDFCAFLPSSVYPPGALN